MVDCTVEGWLYGGLYSRRYRSCTADLRGDVDKVECLFVANCPLIPSLSLKIMSKLQSSYGMYMGTLYQDHMCKYMHITHVTCSVLIREKMDPLSIIIIHM